MLFLGMTPNGQNTSFLHKDIKDLFAASFFINHQTAPQISSVQKQLNKSSVLYAFMILMVTQVVLFLCRMMFVHIVYRQSYVVVVVVFCCPVSCARHSEFCVLEYLKFCACYFVFLSSARALFFIFSIPSVWYSHTKLDI